MRICGILFLICGVAFLGCSRSEKKAESGLPMPKNSVLVRNFDREIEREKQAEPEGQNQSLIKGKVQSVDPLKPPEVKKGEPIYFSAKDFKMQEYMGKSTRGAAESWFRFKGTGEHWYVDWDADRQLFKTIVIHHSATSNDTTADQIEEIQKERLYAPRYRSESKSPFVKGLTVHSAHVINGKERFIGYHHLVYNNGKVTTELSPLMKIGDFWWIDHVGWHAGKWSVNCSSVAICLIGDFSEKEPSESQLKAAAGLVAYYRTLNPKATMTSHGDHVKTECPGKTWPLWKRKLEALLGE